jgi:hypothetical protein
MKRGFVLGGKVRLIQLKNLQLFVLIGQRKIVHRDFINLYVKEVIND